VAAGLAIGTKTTAAPLALLALAGGTLAVRGRLAGLRGPLALAAAAALAVGGVWYLRNLILHGSPTWPFFTTPWGDPRPAAWEGFTNSLLERPAATLEGRLGDYLDVLGGGAVLLAGAVLAPLLAPRREVALASAATLVTLLLWANAPLTGIADRPEVDFSLATVRYMVPILAAAAVPLALAAAAGRRPARLAACALLAAALGWSLAENLERGFPEVPSPLTPLTGALAGALAALALTRLRRPPPQPSPLGTALLAALAGLALAPAASGYVERHAGIRENFDHPVVDWMVSSGALDGDEPVAMSPVMIGPLAGDRLRHRLELIPAGEPCARTEARARRGWVVLADSAFGVSVSRGAGRGCFGSQRPRFEDGQFRIYGSGD